MHLARTYPGVDDEEPWVRFVFVLRFGDISENMFLVPVHANKDLSPNS